MIHTTKKALTTIQNGITTMKHLATLTLLLLTASICANANASLNIGACCYTVDCDTFGCIDTSSADCYSMFGTFDPNETCATIDCSDPVNQDYGACCYQDANNQDSCIFTDEPECLNNFMGTWHQGMPCDCVPCDPDPYGACCYDDPDLGGLICTYVTETHCNQLPSGYWYGPAIPCTDPQVECDLPDENGACCLYYENLANWYCELRTESNCLSNNGWWYGVGSVCSDPGVECETLPDDYCTVEPGANCAGPPQYPDPSYQAFGNGAVAVQTAAPNVQTGVPGLTGSVIMVFDLSGTLPVGQEANLLRYNHPSWVGGAAGSDLGSIYGLAIDEEGNLYVSTSKSWMSGDVTGFGGWGAVYKIDTNTGLPSLFATIPMPNNECGLGSITYDCDHSQFFVSSIEDGIIYRLDMAGNILDSFDHGLPYVGDPGPAAFGDRPWAVEVHENRLFYSMWNENYTQPSVAMANEIWSIALDGTGMPMSGTQHVEIELPPQLDDWSSPVADMDFSPTGTLFLSERSQQDYTTLHAHRSRLLEYECTDDGWILTSNTFLVGGGNGGNAAGGVDATTEYIWGSGDLLMTSPFVYGFQGFPITGGDPSNSVLVDYQGVYDGYYDKKRMGDLVVTDEDGGPGGTGVCCYQDNCESHCDVMTEEDCLLLWASTFFSNTTCEDVACPPPPDHFGACCYEDDAGGTYCIETDPGTCYKLGGIFYPGVPCICINCEQPEPIGACCFLEVDSGYMVCVELTQYDCEKKPESSYAGDNTICDDEYCCKPIGACCVNGQCLLVSVEQCETASGLYYGDGAVCDTIECEYCPADLDNDGDVDVGDILILIAAWGSCPQYLIFI